MPRTKKGRSQDRRPHPDVWLATWDGLYVIRGGQRVPGPVHTLTVADSSREARRVMQAGVLGFSDIEGAPTTCRVHRMPSPGFAGGYPTAIAELLDQGYRFVFPHRRLSNPDQGRLITRLIGPISDPF